MVVAFGASFQGGLRHTPVCAEKHDDVGAIAAADEVLLSYRDFRRPPRRGHLHPGIEHQAHR